MQLKLAGKQAWQTKIEDHADAVYEGAMVEVVSIQQGEVLQSGQAVIDKLYPAVNRLRNAHPVKLHCPLGGHSVGNQWPKAFKGSGECRPLKKGRSELNEMESHFSDDSSIAETCHDDCDAVDPSPCCGPMCLQIRGKNIHNGLECAPPQTVLQAFIGAGLLPGDSMELRAIAGPCTTVEVTSSGATLVFGKDKKSIQGSIWGRDGHSEKIDTQKPAAVSKAISTYSVHCGALLVVACQPMIPCRNANLQATTTINLKFNRSSSKSGWAREHEGGSVLLIDWISSGRKARGECWSFDRVETNTRLYVTMNGVKEKINWNDRARGGEFKAPKSFIALNKEESNWFDRSKRSPQADQTTCVYSDCQHIVGNQLGLPVDLPVGVGHSGVGVYGTVLLVGPRTELLMDHLEKEVKAINVALQNKARLNSIRNPDCMSVKGCDASGSTFLAELDLPDVVASTSRFETEFVWGNRKLGGMSMKIIASSVEKGQEFCHKLISPLFSSLGQRISSKSSQLTAAQGLNWNDSTKNGANYRGEPTLMTKRTDNNTVRNYEAESVAQND